MSSQFSTPRYQIVKKEIDDTHYYFVDDRFLPSVTRILDEAAPTPYALRKFWKEHTPEEAEDIKNITGGFGSKMHDAYEKLLNGLELNLAKDYPTTKEKRHIICFHQWFQDVQPKVVLTENVVASLEKGYAGTLDLLCTINEETWIIDFKTSAGIYFNHELQVTAYKRAAEETYGDRVDKVGILRTGSRHKSGYEFKEIDRPYSDFERVFNTYLSINGGSIPKPPLIDVYPETIKLNLGDV